MISDGGLVNSSEGVLNGEVAYLDRVRSPIRFSTLCASFWIVVKSLSVVDPGALTVGILSKIGSATKKIAEELRSVLGSVACGVNRSCDSCCRESTDCDSDETPCGDTSAVEVGISKRLGGNESGDSSSQELIRVRTLSTEEASGVLGDSGAIFSSGRVGSTHVADSKMRRSRSLTLNCGRGLERFFFVTLRKPVARVIPIGA